MAIVLRRRGRRAWIAGLAAIVVGSHPGLAGATTLEARVASSHDDAEEFATGAMSLSSSDLELVVDGSPQTVGIRWAGAAIPHNATITGAWIQFTCKDAHDQAATLKIRAEDADDAAPFSATVFDLTSRALTASEIAWVPSPWLAGEAGDAERTPDLTAILQAIVSRPGWAPGQAIVIIISGSGLRTAWSWDGNAAAAALLHVEYTGGDPPPPPPSSPIALYAGYYDTHHPEHTQPKPDPWKGSPGVVFVGTSDNSSGGWDSACLRLDNLTWNELTNVVVSVDVGTDFHFALWGTRAIPAHGTLILAQTGFENFDGSDTNEAGCVSCSPTLCMTKVSSTIPAITVKIGSTTTRFFDHDQVLNTHGVDAAGCPYTGGRNDESRDWVYLPPEGLVAGVPLDSLSLPDPGVAALAAPVPNPARHFVTHRFSTPVQGRVQLGMYDVAGRLVRTCVDAELEAGVYLRGVDLAGVQPGVYFSVLRAAGSVARRSFVVAP